MPINENDYVGFGIDPVTGKRHEINHLPVMNEWEPGIYQHEQGDKIIGGIDGIANLPLQQLANRTEYLKGKVENAGGVLTIQITIPTAGWVKDETDTTGYPWHVDIANDAIRASMTPFLTALRESLPVVKKAGMCPTVETLDGALRVYSRAVPESDISTSLALSGSGSGGGGGDISPATRHSLGSVIVGDGLNVTANGTLSVNRETVITDHDLLDEDETEQDLKDILVGETGETVEAEANPGSESE